MKRYKIPEWLYLKKEALIPYKFRKKKQGMDKVEIRGEKTNETDKAIKLEWNWDERKTAGPNNIEVVKGNMEEGDVYFEEKNSEVWLPKSQIEKIEE